MDSVLIVYTYTTLQGLIQFGKYPLLYQNVPRRLCLTTYSRFSSPHSVVSSWGCGETGNAYAGSNQLPR